MSSEQRQFTRFETHILMDVGEDGAASQEDLEAVCIDMSAGGMKVLLPVLLEVGKCVVVTCLMNRRNLENYFLEAQAIVRWCGIEKGSDTFAVGLEFEFLPDEARAAIEELTRF